MPEQGYTDLSDDELFDDFRMYFNRGRDQGHLNNEDRIEYKKICAELRNRGIIKKEDIGRHDVQ